jgi:transcriptional regulator with XRE-family HTH domain
MDAASATQAPESDAQALTRGLGRRIRVLRAERGWSQEVLSALSGLHRTYIGHVERGRAHISVVQLARIARAFGLRPGALIDGPQAVVPGSPDPGHVPDHGRAV